MSNPENNNERDTEENNDEQAGEVLGLIQTKFNNLSIQNVPVAVINDTDSDEDTRNDEADELNSDFIQSTLNCFFRRYDTREDIIYYTGYTPNYWFIHFSDEPQTGTEL